MRAFSVDQVDAVLLRSSTPGLLFQVIDTGPGLKGKDYRTLFDPLLEQGRRQTVHASAPLSHSLSLPSPFTSYAHACPSSPVLDSV